MFKAYQNLKMTNELCTKYKLSCNIFENVCMNNLRRTIGITMKQNEDLLLIVKRDWRSGSLRIILLLLFM